MRVISTYSVLLSILCVLCAVSSCVSSDEERRARDLENAEACWIEFQETIATKDWDAVMELIEYPMRNMGGFFNRGMYSSRQEMKDDISTIINNDVIVEITKTQFSNLIQKTHKGKTYWEYEYWNGIGSEGQFNIYIHIGKVDGKMRILRIIGAG